MILKNFRKKGNMNMLVTLILVIMIGVLVVAIFVPDIKVGGNSFFSFAKNVLPDVNSSNEPANRVESWIQPNVYAFIYITGDDDHGGTINGMESFYMSEIGLEKEFKDKRGCSLGEIPNSLSSKGCWIISAENDDGATSGSDNCANQIYGPNYFGFDYILDGVKLMTTPLKTYQYLRQYCDDSGKYKCDVDALKLIAGVYQYYWEVDFRNKFFKGDLLCGPVNPGEYMWVKCDDDLSQEMKINNEHLKLYDDGLESTISYSCSCGTTNSKGCNWRQII